MKNEQQSAGRFDRTRTGSQTNHFVKSWIEGLENHEKLKQLLPFLQDEEGYL